jgi:TetR/AcrR family transcriptional repressor of nem operon
MTHDTTERILDSAEALAGVRGYNGFSYADISAELAITKPSIHHHFPSKAQLASALVARYAQRFTDAHGEIEVASSDPKARLRAYAALFSATFADGGRICLCAVFAADTASLPPVVRHATAAFFDDQQRWLAATFAQAGVAATRAAAAARTYLAALEGALLLARAGAAPDHPSARVPAAAQTIPSVAETLLDALI